MNKFLFSGILLILFCFNAGLVMAQNPTTPALQFNIFLEKSARLSSNETEGPIALGEDLTLDGNYQVAIKSAGTFMVNKTPIGLLVNGKIIYKSGNSLQVNNGYVKIGNPDKSKVWYTDKNGANSPIQITSGDYNSSPRIQLQSSADKLGVSASNNPVFDKELIDFGKAMETMRNSSLEISKSKQTAVLTDANGKPFEVKKYPDQVKIKLADGVNYLNITGNDLNSVSVFTYENKPDENHVLVINIDADNTFNWKVWNQAGIGIDQCPFVLYNFYNTETLKIEGNSTIEGTVFAPFANIFKKNNSANIEGQVIGLSFEQDAGEIHHAAFRPNLSNVVNCTNPVVDVITGAASVCRSSSITLANTTSSGVWTSSNMAIATVNASGLVTGVAAGIATISYAVTNSCGTTTVTKDITVNIPPSVAAITGTAALCVGSNTTLSNTTVGGVWSSASTNIATVNATGIVTGVTAGTSVLSYTVTANGCSTTANQTVTVNALPVVAAITGTVTVCAGSNTTLSNTTVGGVWSSASTNIATVNATGIVTGVAAGTSVVSYRVTINNCSTTASQTVTVNALPVVAAITGTATVCVGSNTTLSNTTVGGVWSSASTNIATVNATGIVTGVAAGTSVISYTVTANGCSTTANQTVTVNALPVVAAITGTTAVCVGSNTALSNTTVGGVWSSASTNIATVNASGIVTGVAAGSSVVSYTVTASGCSTTATQTVMVSAAPVIAAITGSNNVCLGLTTTLNNATVAGVWSSSNPAVASVTNGIVVGESIGNASIIYTVTDAVCGAATTNLSITVQDCGSVSSGGTGGLESQSLGDAVAKRLYQSALNGTMQQPAYEFMKPFLASNIQKAVTGTMASVPVNSLVPMQLTNTKLKSYLSTPTDIIGITNAKEVVSVDYTLNGSCKAVVFATTTKAAIYDHTKAVCDRLKGAQVVRMDSIILSGLGLLRFTLKYEDGHTENIISFSASTNPARNTIAIQSNWLKSAYIAEETMYNFQVWSVSDELSAEITGKILTQLQQVATVEPLKKSSLLPDTYFVSAKREGANLEMMVQNTLVGTSGYFELQEKANEQSGIVSRKIPFNFSGVQRNSIQLPVSDAFETTVKMFVNNQLQDEVFLSDGAWSVDYNPANTVLNKFEPKNDNRKTVPEELQLYRNVYASVNTNSYFTLLKLMRGGGLPKDISAYQTMKFNANGNGTLKITLVKQSVKNWDDQYFLKIPLSNNPKDYLIDLGDFSSLVNKNRIKPDDINAIVFTVTNSTGNSTNITQNINNLAFSKESISYIQSLSSKEIKVFPNPSTGKFNCVFQSDKDEQLQLSITDASKGIVLYRKTVSALRGSNTVSVDLGSTLQNLSVCVLTLVSEDGNYKPNRILIQPVK